MLICDGKLSLHRLNSLFDTEIPEEEDVLAAYLLKAFDYFPKTGETVELNGLTFKVLEIEGRTIKQVQITKQ